jgi:hemerythrin-like domain-containing protein
MLPVGPLMVEHRLIERMIKVLKAKHVTMSETEKLDLNLIVVTADFFRTYADRCHHGKEEDILFRELARKNLPEIDKKTMQELIEEHGHARKTVTNLLQIVNTHAKGETDLTDKALNLLKGLTEFCPQHIEKEDKHFFFPCMNYFTPAEQQRMLQEFWEFDKKMIHEKYTKIIEELTHSFNNLKKPIS